MAGTTLSTARPDSICLTGVVRRAEEIGFVQRGTHRLFDPQGRLIAALSSNQVNLFALEGQFVTLCGINEGRIEGVLSVLVTQVLRPAPPAPTPPTPPGVIDPRTLIRLLLLTQPQLALNPLLLFLILSGALGRAGLGAGAPGVPGFGLGLGATGLGAGSATGSPF